MGGDLRLKPFLFRQSQPSLATTLRRQGLVCEGTASAVRGVAGWLCLQRTEHKRRILSSQHHERLRYRSVSIWV